MIVKVNDIKHCVMNKIVKILLIVGISFFLIIFLFCGGNMLDNIFYKGGYIPLIIQLKSPDFSRYEYKE